MCLTKKKYLNGYHTWSWLTIDPGLAWTEWLLVEEAEDDRTKELSELSELGLGAEFSTALFEEVTLTGTALMLLLECCCNTLLFFLEAALEVVQ